MEKKRVSVSCFQGVARLSTSTFHACDAACAEEMPLWLRPGGWQGRGPKGEDEIPIIRSLCRKDIIGC